MDRLRKEERREKEVEKTESGVFDKHTMLTLSKLMSNGVIDYIDFPIASGKESFVFCAKGKNKNLAVKIYPINTSIFKNMMRYIEGDPRYEHVKKDIKDVVFTWARKEYINLKEIRKAGVRAPEPIEVRNNVLVMEYIGDENEPAPMLKDFPMEKEEAEECFLQIIDYIKAMYSAKIVHGDLSEYNILVWDGPVVIDVGQAVMVEHSYAQEMLERDIRNIVRFFNKYDIKAKIEEIEQKVKSND
jgi:RIO kinase 1